MLRTFEISFEDFSEEKQEEMIDSCIETLTEIYKSEGVSFMVNDSWFVKPKTWQEAYCRVSGLDYRYWNDLDEKSDEFQTFDWNFIIEQEIQKKAEKACYLGLRNVEVEVEL